MKKVFEYLPLHFCVFVIVGIVLQFYTRFWEFGFTKLLLLILSIIALLFCFPNKIVRTFLSLILFFFIGISTVFVNNDKNYDNYYKSYLNADASAILKIDKVLKSSNYHHKYEVEVIQVDSLKTRGKVLLNIAKDSLLKPLKVDELIYTKPDFVEVNKPLNPHQFDYRFYLEKQVIYQQLYLDKNQYKSVDFKVFSLVGLSAKFRNAIQESLQKYHFKADELAVINALLLGQRQEISKELISDYSKAGAIHILAVSGLHVGIILWILTWLLKPIERLKKGKIIGGEWISDARQDFLFIRKKGFELKEIVPTETDKAFRGQTIHGFVHDPGAAMMGGVGGHAGVFSNANDMAKYMQMLLNNGDYGGKHYLDSATIKNFTTAHFESRRGLGFDKPDPKGKWGSACDSASLASFGHTGFTGTISWADPEENLIYIFLSNRIYPTAENKKLVTMNVRTDIMEVIYASLNDTVGNDIAVVQ